uniref:Peptidase M48 domain-containing protein n=2 Tax=Opuntia streptacantha TaxID=393608 RepID=A0A7C8YP35_OPUST
MMQILMLLHFGGYALIRHFTALFKSFGFHDTQPVLIGFIIFEYTVVPLECLVYFASNLVSRYFEFQADAYAKKLGYAKELQAGLIRLQEENLGTMNPDPWYSAYHYTHPPLVERMSALDDKPDNEETKSSCEGREVDEGVP